MVEIVAIWIFEFNSFNRNDVDVITEYQFNTKKISMSCNFLLSKMIEIPRKS